MTLWFNVLFYVIYWLIFWRIILKCCFDVLFQSVLLMCCIDVLFWRIVLVYVCVWRVVLTYYFGIKPWYHVKIIHAFDVIGKNNGNHNFIISWYRVILTLCCFEVNPKIQSNKCFDVLFWLFVSTCYLACYFVVLF